MQSIAHDYAPHGVATVGEMKVSPNSRNTIPGEVFLTVDIRNPDDEILKAMAEEFLRRCEALSSKNNIEILANEIWHIPPVKFDSDCIAAVNNAANNLGYRNQRMVSGAGHDACQVCSIVPTSMIFVPCEGGLSHNEEESATPEDLEAGCNVLLHAMLEMADKQS